VNPGLAVGTSSPVGTAENDPECNPGLLLTEMGQSRFRVAQDSRPGLVSLFRNNASNHCGHTFTLKYLHGVQENRLQRTSRGHCSCLSCPKICAVVVQVFLLSVWADMPWRSSPTPVPLLVRGPMHCHSGGGKDNVIFCEGSTEAVLEYPIT
jgi:hypothetical protein